MHSERTVGVTVAGIALALRAPVLLAVALAAIVTALARAFGREDAPYQEFGIFAGQPQYDRQTNAEEDRQEHPSGRPEHCACGPEHQRGKHYKLGYEG